MATTLKGATAVWFMSDTSFKAGTAPPDALIGITGTMNLQGTSGSRTADQAMIKNRDGDVISEGYNNDRYEATFDAVPTGATAAALASVHVLPKIGDRILVVEEINSAETFLGGVTITPRKWILDKADWKGDVSSARSLTFSMHRFEHDTSSLVTNDSS